MRSAPCSRAGKELISVISRASAEQASGRETSMKKLAKDLDVHFLVRGTVARSADGYRVTVVGVDGDSERVLATQSLKVANDELTPHWPDETLAAVQALLSAGIEAEVKRARDKPDDALDVRDLTFRATTDWRAQRNADGKAANAHANELLDRALALAPDDLYALRTRATVNLCDCVNAWSKNPDEQKAIGAAAMEKYLALDPDSLYMLGQKAGLYQLRLRWEESLAIADAMLARAPTNAFATGAQGHRSATFRAAQGCPGAGRRPVGPQSKRLGESGDCGQYLFRTSRLRPRCTFGAKSDGADEPDQSA